MNVVKMACCAKEFYIRITLPPKLKDINVAEINDDELSCMQILKAISSIFVITITRRLLQLFEHLYSEMAGLRLYPDNVHDTIRYNASTCAKKPMSSQLSLPHDSTN